MALIAALAIGDVKVIERQWFSLILNACESLANWTNSYPVMA